MTTDTKRREVARRLREIRPCKSGHIEWWKIAQALGLKEPAGWFGWEKFEPDSVNRLADLIEPEPEGTCGNYSHFIKDRFMPCDKAHGHTEADVGACEDFSPLSCDRDALLEIVQAMDSRGKCASEENGGDGEVDAWWLRQYAHLIRETLGVDDGW